ncbi:MAG: adenosylhomocysteinase [Fibrobacter sp.]|nr:adenosylhomocysteinase [Fibrobacter sp.]
MFIDDIAQNVYVPSEYPALGLLTEEWKKTRPFDGCKIIVATPIFRNTTLEYRALLAGGAELFVGKGAMPCDSAIIDILKQNSIPVIEPEDIRQGKVYDDFDLILDCAGQFSFCAPHIGFVELTRSGVPFFNDSPFPVYVADSGIIKRIETTLGTGDGYFRALMQMGFQDFEGKKLVVFGSGKVGCGIALQGVQYNMHVTTITSMRNSHSPNDFVQVLANNGVDVIDFCDGMAEAAVEQADFLVTATGIKSVLSPAIQKILLEHPTIIAANMGVEDELGEQIPPCRVLANKQTLNFILEEPTHLKYIDASLALHAALGERLLQDAANVVVGLPFTGIKDPPYEIEQKLLSTTIQNGLISNEICNMMR